MSHVYSKDLAGDEFGIDGVVIGTADVFTNDTLFDFDGTAGEDPIEGHGDGVGAFDAFSGSALKALPFEFVEEDGRQVFRIEIAPEDGSGTGRVMTQIGEHFIELFGLNAAVAAALKMSVVDNQEAAAELEFGYERDAVTEPGAA